MYLIAGHLIGDVNASVANSNQQITYETSSIPGGVIIVSSTTGAVYVNGSIDADIPVRSTLRYPFTANAMH